MFVTLPVQFLIALRLTLPVLAYSMAPFRRRASMSSTPPPLAPAKAYSKFYQVYSWVKTTNLKALFEERKAF